MSIENYHPPFFSVGTNGNNFNRHTVLRNNFDIAPSPDKRRAEIIMGILYRSNNKLIESASVTVSSYSPCASIAPPDVINGKLLSRATNILLH